MRKLTDYISTAGKIKRLAAVFVISTVVGLAASVAMADHSLQKPCITCHSLRSTNVVPCSRNVLKDQVNDPLYNSAAWQCNDSGGPWANSCNAAETQPLDCGYCHSAPGDIAFEIQSAYGGKWNTVSGVGSSHPVDVVGNNYSYASTVRITCNDCHNGPTGAPKLTPATLCSKNDTDGYPNHIDAVINSTVLPGSNDLTKNRPWLTYPYGPEPASPAPYTTGPDWTKTTFAYNDVLCFVCHDKSNSTKPPFSVNLDETNFANILGEYNLAGGGHNVAGIGSGVGGVSNKKMPCYDCHDPHSGVDSTTRANKALIISVPTGSGIINPYDPNASDTAAFTYPPGTDAGGYNPSASGDRALCVACHAAASTVQVEGVKPVSLSNPIASANLKFGFHANAHATAISSGNCLQQNGGCHQSPHNTSPFDCLGCHTKSIANFANVPDLLKRVANVDSEFDGIGAISGNAILSQHNISFNRTGDLSSNADNGCLSCHNVAGNVNGRKVGLPDGTTFVPPVMDNRESLTAYDAFCAGCHDATTDGGEVFGGLLAPRVEKYFTKSGHGTGFATGVHFESGNTDSKIPCLECHMYHGSTAYKLLPGNRQTTDWQDLAPSDAGGRVVKGFDYTTLTESTATKFTIGGVTNSLAIDYRDYTIRTNNTRLPNDDNRSWKYSNYTNNPKWSTYYEAATNNTLPPDPAGAEVQFGTSGDIIDTTKLGCTDYAQNAGVEEIGFCYTCHLYNNNEDGVVSTFNKIYTHEGVLARTNCNGKDYPSNRNFKKDCTECHDVHGSGAASGDNPSWYMVRGKVTTGYQTTVDTFNVVYDDTESNGIFTGQDSQDELDLDNRDDLCAVCHTQTTHNTRTPVVDHYQGDCFVCHPHGVTSERPWVAFPGKVSACNGCHGFPPQRPGTASNIVPPEENYGGGGGPHIEHVNFLASKTGADLADFSNATKLVCAPCHGDNGPVHSSGNGWGKGVWGNGARAEVGIGQRNPTSWGGLPRYDARVVPVSTSQVAADDTPGGSAMTLDNSRCASVDCHNDSATTKLAWYVTTAEPDPAGGVSGALAQDAPNRARVCFDCHRAPSPDIRVYDNSATPAQVYGKKGTIGLPPANTYDPVKINAAANYFGTVSTYGRGGHGDPKLGTLAPDGEINSDTAHEISPTSPIDCTACHDWQAPHFPVGAANMWRLRNLIVEDSLHQNGLCNECHNRNNYPGFPGAYRHHPSFVSLPAPAGYDAIKREVDGTTTWTPTNGVYEQNAYAPTNTVLFGLATNKDVDYFTDWYNRGIFWTTGSSENHNQTYPRPVFLYENGATNSSVSPKATLPLAEIILGTDTGKFMCVTCHNPHGTDLFIYDPDGIGRDIADHNMLRLQPTDNTLCNACH